MRQIVKYPPQGGKDNLKTLQKKLSPVAVGSLAGRRMLNEDSENTKIVFSYGSNNLDFVPLSSLNNGLSIEPISRATNNSIPTSFYSGPGGSWSFYTNAIKRLNLDADGYIKTSKTSLLINWANPEESYSIKVHGNAGFDSTITLGQVSETTSFISMNVGIKSTYTDLDDKKSVYTTIPTTWASGKSLPIFRLRHLNNVAPGISTNISTGKDFMILPYEYVMAIEYNGMVECWVAECSIHRGDLYTDVEGKGNGWGVVLWVGDDKDGGGIRSTTRNNLFSGRNVNYGELSVEKFTGTANGDFRLRLPSTNNQFHFVYGERGSTNIVAKVSDKGFFIPKVSSSAAILIPEKGQVYFDSSKAEFKGYNGSEFVNLSNKLITSNTTLSADGIHTFYQISHSLGTIPTYFNVISNSIDVGDIRYITGDDNYLKIYYFTAPPAGTKNLSWNWQVKKYLHRNNYIG